MYFLFVVTGPSGVGKTHLANILLGKYPDVFESVKIYTTRKARTDELGIDRIFLSEQEFDARKLNGEFAIHGIFGGHQYGYTEKSLTPVRQHKIINAWPSLIPKFFKLPGTIIIGLSVNNSDISMLKHRILERGDSARVVKDRLLLIQNDLNDLTKYKDMVNQKGKIFRIKSDDTIPNKVLPWIETTAKI